MNTYWDIIGSLVISSLFMITLFTFHNNLLQERSMSNLWIITQEDARSLSDVIEYDLRKIGYRVPKGNCAFISADSTGISFLSDLDDNGVVDSVRFYASETSKVSSTDNPDDMLFYRIVNGQSVPGSALGLTYFKVSYYDSAGVITDVLDKIREIEVEFNIESSMTVDRYYPFVFIKKKVKPKNIL